MTGLSMSGSEGDVQMLARAAAGDELAFTKIVEAYHTDMRRVAYVVSGDLDLAEDAVQQAWHIAWKKLATVRDPDRLRSWLVAVAANEARQVLRRRRRHREVELPPGWTSPFEESPRPDDRLLDLTAALRRLSSEERGLLAMRFVIGMNATEISSVTNASPAGVRSRLARLLARLREDLTDV